MMSINTDLRTEEAKSFEKKLDNLITIALEQSAR